MKKVLSKSSVLLLCHAASITACKQSNAFLQPASYIHTFNKVIKVDPINLSN